MTGLHGGRWRVGCGAVLLGSLCALVPALDDLGLTYDEPAYRYSQEVSIQWWEQVPRARGREDLDRILDRDALLYYWPYGRHGINFHPPLAGQLNLLTYALMGRWLGDIPARRLASALAGALTAALLFGFLSRRYGFWAGFTAAAALLCMPRVFGQVLLIDTDTPGMLLWTAAALAFWKGLHEPDGGPWRAAVGLLVGLAFVEKMATVLVLLPMLAWLIVGRLPRASRRDWLAGLTTTALLAAPLAAAYVEVRRLARLLPPPSRTDLFLVPLSSALPGVVLLAPLGIWVVVRLLARRSKSERPGLETWQAIVAFGPAVAWLGNPAWWRETMVRLAHYYLLNTDRRGALTDIRILYLGETYEFNLPWHNGWVLIGVTVPASLLCAACVGLIYAVLRWFRRDRLPGFFVLNLVTPPALRMLPTPAHDGVRLMLPSFVFLAALAGWGVAWLGNGLARRLSERFGTVVRLLVCAATIGPAAWQLMRIHPYELSYYNEWVGGPRGAWRRGFELSYWYDAFNPKVVRELEATLPAGATISFPSELSAPSTFLDLQALGGLRGDLRLGSPRLQEFPFMWLLTHDSKIEAFTALLFLMRPWYASEPYQLDGLRVASVVGPEAVSRAWALKLLAVAHEERRPRSPPNWPFGRLTLARRPVLDEGVFAFARDDPAGLIAAAEAVARGGPLEAKGAWLRERVARNDAAARTLLRLRPEALVEAARILTERHAVIRAALSRRSFTDAADVGGYLDESARR